jgi:hypothetical protein
LTVYCWVAVLSVYTSALDGNVACAPDGRNITINAVTATPSHTNRCETLTREKLIPREAELVLRSELFT